jgi:site-specific DNA recombinase
VKQYFAYIRVSSAKQGEKGVSLQEQRDAISRYAQRYSLKIVQWYEERETAAKRGRPVFSEMLKQLRKGKGNGVVIHKIDRGARNLKDWADLGDLIDAGVEVHFANESLDLNTRGGRLSADIQAVVAADYIRNLREETKKGFYGRLKQGLYPLPAPVGYLDRGKGKPKEPDPETAPLIACSFELYATGKYSLDTLLVEMRQRGLRNRRAGRMSRNGLSILLNNPFYAGFIRIKRTGELFPGKHCPLISKLLFDSVQELLEGRTKNRENRHSFTYRRMVKCLICGHPLVGELQKGHVYYRCHTPGCLTKTVREERIEEAISAHLEALKLTREEIRYAGLWLDRCQSQVQVRREQELQACRLRLDLLRNRLMRLTDLLIDGAVDRRVFDERKDSLLWEEKDLEERIAMLEGGDGGALKQLHNFLELVKRASLSYELANPEGKRSLVSAVTSNLGVSGKNIAVELRIPFRLVAERPANSCGVPYRDTPRTWEQILSQLLGHYSQSSPADAH